MEQEQTDIVFHQHTFFRQILHIGGYEVIRGNSFDAIGISDCHLSIKHISVAKHKKLMGLYIKRFKWEIEQIKKGVRK